MVGSCLGIFYDDNAMVGSRDLDWIQGALHVLISLLRRYGLVANFVKLKSMTCQLGTLRSGMSEEAVGRCCTGRGAI